MRRTLAIVTAVAALLLPVTVASAKGPTAVRITGLASGPIDITGQPGSGEPRSGGDVAHLAEVAGLWANTFDRTEALTDDPPTGDLGPRLRLRWVVPGPDGEDIAVQDLHPWADAGAVTFTRPDQDYAGTTTRGGWYVGGEALRDALTDAGVPAQAPSSGARLDGVVAVVAGAVLALGTSGLVGRRWLGHRRRATLASA